jgi:Tol biopolymer transport system component
MTPAGGAKTVTTAGTGLARTGEPSWSPDGGSIAFPGSTRGVDGAQIFRIGRSGASLRSLRTFPSAADAPIAAWSPDGDSIAFDWSSGGDPNPCACYRLETIGATDGRARSILVGSSDDPHAFDASGWRALP